MIGSEISKERPYEIWARVSMPTELSHSFSGVSIRSTNRSVSTSRKSLMIPSRRLASPARS
ncbi:hypothetical protein SAMN05421812_10757 [Asanoa hainanensis]|uniref:Uncharacterized protein n=1 Tax=Asanoa hainanensis TaxID=560556 RepID=A0A239N0W6_9ACTN|nr:hypothetical protein SAMN05421812_10757 [Asanoa hainanensis]